MCMIYVEYQLSMPTISELVLKGGIISAMLYGCTVITMMVAHAHLRFSCGEVFHHMGHVSSHQWMASYNRNPAM